MNARFNLELPVDEIRLAVAPIPVSLARYYDSMVSGKPPQHSSCWGEWYLACLKGSENLALGIDRSTT